MDLNFLQHNSLYPRGATGAMAYYNTSGSPELTSQSSQIWTNTGKAFQIMYLTSDTCLLYLMNIEEVSIIHN
ncbi:unnamed protein product [Acanthoscelides obtectus]|uniref:Uncharacterized protein n=1 Tax=Acanthoscelides obtectus TaxID=200917 RepID=A0A9P0PDR4_ACAOB|nr:unnamed protein product [Acanthoscelides obtectus]CAK1651942.1 hypothetical protein AOBTE_LOCUS17564 [Acanthoscelides obtectus]